MLSHVDIRRIFYFIFNFFFFSDLQLAAEIGKALLERNKELERETIQLQSINGEQALEIDVKKKNFFLVF